MSWIKLFMSMLRMMMTDLRVVICNVYATTVEASSGLCVCYMSAHKFLEKPCK